MIRRRFVTYSVKGLALVLLAACARPLSETEDAFAEALFAETLDREVIRVRAGIGITPLPTADEPGTGEEAAAQAPPENVCERVEQTERVRRWPAAFVLWNSVFFSNKYYLPDTFAGWPKTLPYQSLIMAHELVHVWQWQNRARTGYDPATSAGESVAHVDPYFFTPDATRPFLAYGYEQQAAMVEDYLCYQLFNPRAPRAHALEQIIDPALPLDDLRAWLGR